MLTSNNIKNYIDNYYVTKGQVFLKKGDIPLVDEQTILEVKSSYLIFNKAKESYQEDMRQFGKTNGNVSNYVSNTMKKLSVHGEINDFGINKLINSILRCNGEYRESIGSEGLTNSKFSIFDGEQKDYGLAYLRLKFREVGLDLDNFKLDINTDNFKINGVSEVTIKYDQKEYNRKLTVQELHNLRSEDRISHALEQLEVAIKNKDSAMIDYWKSTISTTIEKSKFSHSKSKILNDLELRKKESEKNGDSNTANYFISNMKMIIDNNPIKVTPKEWDEMNNEQRSSFFKIKMKEAKLYGDEDTFNYWNANLNQISKPDLEIKESVKPNSK